MKTAKNDTQHCGDTGLQHFIASSKYARFVPALNRRETWAESVERVRAMHLGRFTDCDLDSVASGLIADGVVSSEVLALAELDGSLHEAIDSAFDAVAAKEAFPSMRSMQFGGRAISGRDGKHARIYNCSTTPCDRIEMFSEAFWLLLCGVGVGFSVQQHHVAKLPCLVPATGECSSHLVADTIEGWADALKALMLAAVDGRTVSFDFSQIRAAGSPLKTSGGKAPGPEPLRTSLAKIGLILTHAAGRRLGTVECYDILCWAAKAVLSGGIRRSAMIALFSVGDEAMASAKTGDWFATNPQRSASNNSAVIVRNEVTREQFEKIFAVQKEFGEPGFWFTESAEYSTNPCVEITMHPRLQVTAESAAKLRAYGYTGELVQGEWLSGVQFCNLTSISGPAATTPAKFYRLCARAALIGTLQAAYTKFDYLSPVSRIITENEALLGVSICGILDQPEVLLNPAVLEQGAAVVKAVNQVVARALGIRPAARCTATKPEGTLSLLINSGSGIHPHHSRRYIRRVQVNAHDPLAHYFGELNPHMIERSVYDQNGMTNVISFAVEAPETALVRDQVTAVQQLEYVAIVQRHWVQPGRQHEEFAPGAHHNVSNTISVKDDEWTDVCDFIWSRRELFTGVAMLPFAGDKLYAQSPREAVTTRAELERWNAIREDYLPVDFAQLSERTDSTELKQAAACAGGRCELA